MWKIVKPCLSYFFPTYNIISDLGHYELLSINKTIEYADR